MVDTHNKFLACSRLLQPSTSNLSATDVNPLSRPVTPKLLGGKLRSEVVVKATEPSLQAVEPAPVAAAERSRSTTGSEPTTWKAQQPPEAEQLRAVSAARDTSGKVRVIRSRDQPRQAEPAARSSSAKSGGRGDDAGGAAAMAEPPRTKSAHQARGAATTEVAPLAEVRRGASAKKQKVVGPSQKALEKLNEKGENPNLDEYYAAFSTRAKIPKTPEKK